MFSQKRILLVDNDEDTCSMLSVFLEADYKVIPALTLVNGLELAKRDRFDLCLVDFYLPDGTGWELFQQIRAFDASTPVIFCSGCSRESIQQQALQTDAHAFLVKPIDLDVLAKAIACAIDRQK